MTTDARELLELARTLAEEAGAFLLEELPHARTMVTTKSTPTDMVTEMDRAVEQLIATRLRSARPDDGILGEEGSVDLTTSGVRWIIDPIDGTTNYIYGLPAFSVSIAAEVDGEVVAGVVHNPVLAETYAAALGAGATLGRETLRVAGPPTLATALVATGFGYEPSRRGRQAEILTRVIREVRDIRRFGSAALDLCGVAAGRTDAYFERGTQRWDYAAGAMIAREAGAWVGDLDGGEPSRSMVIAVVPQLADAFLDLLRRAGAGEDY